MLAKINLKLVENCLDWLSENAQSKTIIALNNLNNSQFPSQKQKHQNNNLMLFKWIEILQKNPGFGGLNYKAMKKGFKESLKCEKHKFPEYIKIKHEHLEEWDKLCSFSDIPMDEVYVMQLLDNLGKK